jgi:hypothetical protein
MVVLTHPPVTASPAGKPCTAEQAAEAENSVDSLSTWPAIHESFSRFGHCDDGAIAEGYSSAVGAMLADRWSQLADLTKWFRGEPAFRTFVLRHVDVTAERSAFDRLVANAAVRCPPQSGDTCQAILNRAREIEHEQRRQKLGAAQQRDEADER